MIELIDGLKDEVVGFHGHGKITKSDYENVLIPEVEAHLNRHDKVSILCHLGPDFTGYEAAAAWEDGKLGLSHLRQWDKIAVVTDNSLVKAGVKAAAFLMPGTMKLYSNAEFDNAKAWVQE